VRRKVRDREKKREDLLTKSTDQNCKLYLNISEAQFCGRSPRERVNHVYFCVVCMINAWISVIVILLFVLDQIYSCVE
jgi:hypothetical protein